ncbi:MAG TPA: ABC transporter permease [Methylomirabilota bacterium]|nr:ABC transporter permease [Methylomirabilota bacterium]
MNVFRHLTAGLKELVRRDKTESELSEELNAYLHNAAAAKVQAGATPEEALRSARLELGGMETVKYEVRAVGWEFALEVFMQDIRYGLRMLRKAPLFTAVAVTTIAIGIGANTAIFSLVDAILLRPLPYPESQRLIVGGTQQRGASGMDLMGAADFLAWRDRQQSFEQVAVLDQAGKSFALSGMGAPERIPGVRVSANFFSIFGVAPLKGRGFQPGEDRSGTPGVVVISEQFWRDHLGSDPEVLNRALTLDGKLHTIVGVMPAGFRFPSRSPVDVWAIRTLNPPASRPPYGLVGLGRLKPGVSIRKAVAELNDIAAQVTAQYPSSPDLVGVMMPMKEWMVSDISTALLVLLGAIALVLLIVVVNVANLLLARATVRQREVAVRMALGASRKRVVRQLLTESAVLSLLGGVIGLFLAYIAVRAFLAFGPGQMPRLEEVGINSGVLLFTFVVCVGSGILFGLAPALETSRPSLIEPLKDANRSSSSASAYRTHRALLVFEVALALIVMIGSGLLVRSFVRLSDVNPGIQTDYVITAAISLPNKYADPPQITQFWQQFLEKVQTLPGVKAAGITMSLPPNLLAITNPFTVEGQAYDRNHPLQLAEEMTVSPGYFRSLGIPLVKGRFFSPSDKVESIKDPMIVIINETMAKQYFGSKDPIGFRIQTGDPDPNSPWETIVGVVGDVKYSGLDSGSGPTLYVPYNENGWAMWAREMYLVVRSSGSAPGIVPAIRTQLAGMDSTIPLAQIRTMDELLDESLVQQRFRTWLVTGFAALALLLSAIGIYGLISYSVSQRTREIGVRIALGAQRSNVLGLVLRDVLQVLAFGLLLGLVGALSATRIMQSLLYSTSATDPLSFAATSFTLIAVALLACYIPAHRATKVDPMVALRYE